MLSRRLHRGVTLIEMSITIAIAAILIALAVPSFKIMLANAQIRTAAQALHDGLQLARVEAIRRNERVIFSKGTQSAWTVSIESDASTVQTRPYTEGSTAATVSVTPNGATQVTFNALGRVVANTDASNSITQLDTDVPITLIPAADSRELRITITTGGAIRLCDPNVTPGVGMGC
ncbi:MAG: GspH/FimT family protein [Burkholderiaceae bacterium]|nr:GspH/FimT family protein [Burkholderiaceae bacterium]